MNETGQESGKPAPAEAARDLATELTQMQEALAGELERRAPGIQRQFPSRDLATAISSRRHFLTHTYVNRSQRQTLEHIRADHGDPALACYQKLVLLHSMRASLDQILPGAFPPGIVDKLNAWYARVLDDMTRQPDTYYDLACRDFICDIGVCALRSLPVGGAWYIQIRRVGLRSLQTWNMFRVARVLGYLAFRTRGVTPFCVIHTFPRYLPRFTPCRMHAAYRQIGEVIRHNPRIRGIYRRSWLLDPKLADISPNLMYLADVPRQHGAVLFKAGTLPLDVSCALANSPHRRALYESGAYKPAAYAYLWPKKALLQWLDSETDDG